MLVVEHDPVVGELIAHQALAAAGYDVRLVHDSAAAIQEAIQNPPDAIIVNLEMPGLSGKDLMIALTAQRIDIPVIVLARKGMESDIIQAYRLGVADYLLWPVREAEVLTVIDRVLKQGRNKREREMLAHALQRTNQELQSRLRSMKTIFSIGKAILSINDRSILLERILENAASVAKADVSWLLLRDENREQFLLAACKNLPESLQAHLNQPWDDGVSSLVARSGKALSLQGDALKQFRFSSLGKVILILPILVQTEIIGLMVLMRRQQEPFNETEQAMLEGICDYTSLALVNSRLFRAIGERSGVQEAALSLVRAERDAERERHEKAAVEILKLSSGVSDPGVPAPQEFANGANDFNTVTIRETKHVAQIVELLALPYLPEWTGSPAAIPLSRLITHLSQRIQRLAQQDSITIYTELDSSDLTTRTDPTLLALMLEGLISNAIKFNRPGGQVIIRMQKQGKFAVVSITDTGRGVSTQHTPYLFASGSSGIKSEVYERSGGPGIGLARIREIALLLKSEIAAESKPGKGSTFTLTLPLV